jgi:7-cyano-7-deazaguanine synthase
MIAILSGGLDSTTMVYDLLDQGYRVDCVSFNYGQRHNKELQYAENTARRLKLRYDVIDLTNLSSRIAESNSALVQMGEEVPEGHYAQDTMKATVVPNRNMIMLAIAGGIGVARKAVSVATGVHSGDHAIYPDCRPEFIHATSLALLKGNEGFGYHDMGIDVYAPYVTTDKTQIAATAIMLDVPLEDTWSCYKGGAKHCGRCGTCVERLEAINDALLQLRDQGNPKVVIKDGDVEIRRPYTSIDKTQYEDISFWSTQVNPRERYDRIS